MKKFHIKFDSDSKNKLLQILIKYKRMFFMIYFFAVLIFSFQVIYEDAFVEIKYNDYVESEDKVIANLKSANRLSLKLIEAIKLRKLDFIEAKGYEYNNPFVLKKIKEVEPDIIDEVVGDEEIMTVDVNILIDNNDNNFQTIDQY
ncbi:hypothetical protein K0B03_04305 [Patescibacteria group bacterium]|nr:hypothetical protein [Patescibacteria group bacterium]